MARAIVAFLDFMLFILFVIFLPLIWEFTPWLIFLLLGGIVLLIFFLRQPEREEKSGADSQSE